MSVLCCSGHSASVILPSAVLLSSVMGSLHCVGMCGGLVSAVCPTLKTTLLYHFGRGIGYTLLGGLSASMGGLVLKALPLNMSAYAGIGLSIALIISGLLSIFQSKFHPDIPYIGKLFRNFFFKSSPNHPSKFAFSAGLGSVFLPCGWLYSLLLASAALGSFYLGSAYLFLFWIGTLPALIISPLLFRKFLRPISKYVPQLSGLILCITGILTIGYRFI